MAFASVTRVMVPFVGSLEPLIRYPAEEMLALLNADSRVGGVTYVVVGSYGWRSLLGSLMVGVCVCR